MHYSESDEEVAARWRREDSERGAADNRGAMVLSPAEMDKRTAASIRAQRDLAARLGGRSIETWDEAYKGDVIVMLRGVEVAYEVVASDWGVWWADKWEHVPDDRIVVCYDRQGLRPRGMTTIGEVRRAPVETGVILPNRLLRRALLRPGLFYQEGLW